jgi:hypothetical protein
MEYIIIENTYNNNLCSDISNIELTKYYTNKHKKLEEITEPFLDNIMLFKLFAPHEMVGTYIEKYNGLLAFKSS